MRKQYILYKYRKNGVVHSMFLKGRVNSIQVPQTNKTGRFIDGHPPGYLVGKSLYHHFYIGGKMFRNLCTGPAALLMQPQRQVPMKQRTHGFDSCLPQFPDQVLIKPDSLLVHHAFLWHNPRPTDRKAIGFQPHFFHQCHIFLVAMVMIACLVPVFITLHMSV